VTEQDKQVLDKLAEQMPAILAELREDSRKDDKHYCQGVTDVFVGDQKFGVHVFVTFHAPIRTDSYLVKHLNDPSIAYYVMYDFGKPGRARFTLGDTIRKDLPQEIRDLGTETNEACELTITHSGDEGEEFTPKWTN
jgi:hypothetical protein